MRRIMMIILSVILAMGMVAGCANDVPETTTPEKVASTTTVFEEETETIPVETTELVTEEVTEQPTEEKTIGSISLEQIQSTDNPTFCVAYEDGSFDIYDGAGYRKYVNSTSDAYSGIFLSDRIADRLPAINADTKMVLFCKYDFYLYAYPVQTAVNTISYSFGYGMIDDRISGYGLRVYYPDGDIEDISLNTINGKPTEEYEPVVYDKTVHPYSGMKSETRRVVYFGFQNEEPVTLGLVSGTKIVEEKYEVNSKYYHCYSDDNNYDEADSYKISWNPTVEGYAELDFSELPEGQYVLELGYWNTDKNGRRYTRVMLLTIEK